MVTGEAGDRTEVVRNPAEVEPKLDPDHVTTQLRRMAEIPVPVHPPRHGLVTHITVQVSKKINLLLVSYLYTVFLRSDYIL